MRATMRKLAILSLVAAILSGCANSKVINGKTYEPYGLINPEDKDPGIVYRIPPENWVVGVIFSETVLIPGYIVLFDLYEPVRAKGDAK